MKYKLTKAEQETVINFDNELDTASIYTHDSRLIKKLRELRKQYPEQFILEHREHGSVTYTIPKRCVGIRPPYSEKRREQQRQEAKENGLPFMEKGGHFLHTDFFGIRLGKHDRIRSAVLNVIFRNMGTKRTPCGQQMNGFQNRSLA